MAKCSLEQQSEGSDREDFFKRRTTEKGGKKGKVERPLSVEKGGQAKLWLEGEKGLQVWVKEEHNEKRHKCGCVVSYNNNPLVDRLE